MGEAEAAVKAGMRYISVCSGVEAASLAWEPLGWSPLAFAEVEKFPSAVLAHRWPDVPNLGDMTAWRSWPAEMLAAADVLVGGTPCQAFSVAGRRGSLSDERGNLSLQFVELANAIDDLRRAVERRPSTVVWENVPGVFSTDDNAFGCFLGAMAGCGEPLVPPRGLRWQRAGVVDGPRRRLAWRVLDSQHFGVPQRRKRVFVVAHERSLGWACADALLPVREGLPGDSEARGSPGSGTSPGASGGARAGRGAVAHTLRGEGFAGSEDGSGRGTPLVPVVSGPILSGNSPTGGRSRPGDSVDTLVVAGVSHHIAFNNRQDPISGPVAQPVTAKDNGGGVLAFDWTTGGAAAGTGGAGTDIAHCL